MMAMISVQKRTPVRISLIASGCIKVPVTCFFTPLIHGPANKWQQRYLAGLLDRNSKLALMFGTGTCDSSWDYFSTFCDELPERFGSLLMTGFFLGEFLEKHLSVEKTILYTGLAVLATCAIFLFIYSLTSAQEIEQIISNYLHRQQTLSSQLFSESAQLYPEIQANQQALEKASSLFMIAFPAILINSYLTMVWLNILLIKKLLLKKGIIIKSIENLNQWKAPDYLVFGVIITAVLLLLPQGVFKFISINGLIILMFVYFFQGIAIASFYFQKKSVPRILRLFFYTLIAIQPLFMFIVIGFGLFDTWINFRKLDTVLR